MSRPKWPSFTEPAEPIIALRLATLVEAVSRSDLRRIWVEVLVLTFNDLLALERIDATHVRLVRHQDNRLRAGRLYEAWRNDRGAFDDYQSVQRRNRFAVGDLLASFVVTEARKTVFVGLYRVGG